MTSLPIAEHTQEDFQVDIREFPSGVDKQQDRQMFVAKVRVRNEGGSVLTWISAQPMLREPLVELLGELGCDRRFVEERFEGLAGQEAKRAA